MQILSPFRSRSAHILLGTLLFTVSAFADAPTITNLTPASATVGSSSLTLTIIGANFGSAPAATVGGAALGIINATDTLIIGSVPTTVLLKAGNYQVIVQGGGHVSNPFPFTVNNVTPKVTSFSPASASAGSPPVIITINGANFLPGMTATFNGASLSTTNLTPNQASVLVPASLLTSPGDYPLSAINPPPSLGPSPPLTFHVTPSHTFTLSCPSTLVTAAGGLSSLWCTVTPLDSSRPTLDLSCQNLRAESACTFNPSSLSLANSPTTFSLYLTQGPAPGASSQWCFALTAADHASPGNSQTQNVCVTNTGVHTGSFIRSACDATSYLKLNTNPNGKSNSAGVLNYNFWISSDAAQLLSVDINAVTGGAQAGPLAIPLQGANAVKVYDGDPCAGGAEIPGATVAINVLGQSLSQPLHGGSTAANGISVSLPSGRQKMWLAANFRLDVQGLHEFHAVPKISAVGACDAGCTLSNPVPAPLLVSSVPPQQLTLSPQGTFNGVYSNGSASQAITDLKLTGTLQVQFLTLLPNGAALPGPDGRDYVPFVATGMLQGNSPVLGGAVDASFNLPGLGAPAGFVVESANGKSGMLDVAPLGGAGGGRVFFSADPLVDLPSGDSGDTDFPFVLTGAVNNLVPLTQGPYATPVDGEAPLTSGTTIIKGGGGGGCAVARFDYIHGAGAQRAAAVAVLWLPLMILMFLRRRARRAPVR